MQKIKAIKLIVYGLLSVIAVFVLIKSINYVSEENEKDKQKQVLTKQEQVLK